MRDIKFRIYNPIEKRMIESGATPMMLHSFFKNTAPLNTRDEMECQQFTGLKDKNGVDLDWWEDDLFRLSGVLYKIIFDEGCFWFKSLRTDNRFLCKEGTWIHPEEKIGTIHENPELLK